MRRLGPEYKDTTEYLDSTLQEWLADATLLLGQVNSSDRFGDSWERVVAYGALALLTDAELGRNDRLRTHQGLGMVGALVNVGVGDKTFQTSNPFQNLPQELVATWGTSRFSLKVIGAILQTEGDSSTPYIVEA